MGDPTAARTAPVALHRIVVGSGLGAAGAALIVAGTFLPWVDSSGVLRNSYAIAGLLERLDLIDNGAVRIVLTMWPFIGPLCLVPVILGILRWWRLAGIAAILVGLVVGAVATTAVVFTGGKEFAGIHVAGTGPWAMVAGAATLLTAGLLLAIPTARRHCGPSWEGAFTPGV